MTNIQEHFSAIQDPRIEKKCKHKLSDILLIALFTYLSNGEDYEDMVLFAEKNGPFLSDYLSLPNGVPSHDTFNRVFQLMEPDVLRACLSSHGRSLVDVLAEKQVCFDGKKLKGVSPTSKGNAGLYIVNAWVSENKICVGQKKVDGKSNEIVAIPALIGELDIKDAVVTIDAVGCQKAIAEQIITQGGHYLLAVKNNQKTLLEDIECAFRANKALFVAEGWEYARGRFETRGCHVLSAKDTLLEEVFSGWEGLKTIVKVEAQRLVKDTGTSETRYYISDEEGLGAKYYNSLARGHWGIENNLHWHLDVTFKEDGCRARTKNAPENLSTLRKLALQIITGQKNKLSIKKRRVKAAYDLDYLKDLIT